MGFEPGKSGNPGGRPKRKLFTEALRVQMLSPVEYEADGITPKMPDLPAKPRQIDVVVHSLISEARDGENRTQAIKEIRDTLEGKPAQAVEHSGVIATTHEEYLKQLDTMTEDDDSDRTDDTPSA